MASLLHWAFAPGLKFEELVHSRFGSLVHFSPSLGTKEFFLVVSFSSASFPLTVESVGIVLQCCIGGLAQGFNVHQLAKQNFHFSVASNRVGHFVYGLKDRIWPNFGCHFRLFKDYVDYSLDDLSWHWDREIPEVSSRSHMVIKSSLDFLSDCARGDVSSASELQKFGFNMSNVGYLGGSHQDHLVTDSNTINFGSFKEKINLNVS